MFHHKAFVIRWLILFTLFLYTVCYYNYVLTCHQCLLLQITSFGIKDDYLYGNLHCYCFFFFFFRWQSCAVLPILQSVKFTGWTIVGLIVLEVLGPVDEDDATGEEGA